MEWFTNYIDGLLVTLFLIPSWLVALFGFTFGAMMGSFFNVVRYRVPRGESLTSPSACGSCRKPVPWYLNVPIFAYLVLRGRCKYCGSPYSVIYVVYEVIFGALFAIIALVVIR